MCYLPRARLSGVIRVTVQRATTLTLTPRVRLATLGRPDARNPNYLQRLIIPAKLPSNDLSVVVARC